MAANEQDSLSTSACSVPGCAEHYLAGPGDRVRNHSTRLRWVTGDSATDEHEVVSVATWMEVREHLDGTEPTEVVGVISKEGIGDAEMTASQLRQFALHLLAVANQVDALSGEQFVKDLLRLAG